MKNKFLQMFEYLGGIRGQREAIRTAIAQNKKWLEPYVKHEKDFPQEVDKFRSKIAELEAQEQGLNIQIMEKLMTDGQELVGLMDEAMNQPIDHSDQKLKDALAAIDRGVLDYKQASDLAYQFRGNQPVLHYLKQNYAKAEISSNIDTLIYDPLKVEQSINDMAWHVALRDGAPESVQSFLGKAAAHYGIQLPGVDMDALIESAIHAGAGLPVPE